MKIPLPRPVILFLLPVLSLAQPAGHVIHLWANGAPGFESRKDEPEKSKDWWVKNINNPSLTVFAPPKGTANGCAVIVVPGGGFHELVYDREGVQAAQYLNTLGITAFVLKYRLPEEPDSPYSMDHVRQDAHRAVRLVRSRAMEFSIDPNRIGLLGFSAGGVVVTMVAFDPGDGDPQAPDPVDRVNGRPNFQMLVYPGGEAMPQIIPHDSPPAFLLCANDDEPHATATLELVAKFRKAGVPVELHLLARGKHAFNMGDRSEFSAVKNWPHRLGEWLSDSGYLKPWAGPNS